LNGDQILDRRRKVKAKLTTTSRRTVTGTCVATSLRQHRDDAGVKIDPRLTSVRRNRQHHYQKCVHDSLGIPEVMSLKNR
jgi:hypothetical protein